MAARVQTYVGWDEVEGLFFDELIPYMHEDDTEYALGTSYEHMSFSSQYEDFWLEYNKRRKERGFKKEILMNNKDRDLLRQEMDDAGVLDTTKMKFLEDSHDSVMDTHVFRDKVVLVVWGEKPVATLYSREEMARAFTSQFQALWNIANP